MLFLLLQTRSALPRNAITHGQMGWLTFVLPETKPGPLLRCCVTSEATCRGCHPPRAPRVAAWHCRAQRPSAVISRDACIRRFAHSQPARWDSGTWGAHQVVPCSVLRLAQVLGTETHCGRVVPIVADADEGLVVLIGAPDDCCRGALPVRVGRGLVCYGDGMPGEILLRVGFDDSLLCGEPGGPNFR